MKRVLGTVLLLIGASVAVWASDLNDGSFIVPEIDAASGGTVVALLSGAMLMLRARRKN